MSFIDELRSYDEQKETMKKMKYEAEQKAERMIHAITTACQDANRQGLRNISGYVRFYSDDGYAEQEFKSKLPTVSGYEEHARKYNSDRNYCLGGGWSYHKKREDRLYSDYFVSQGNLDYVQALKSELLIQIMKLGFENFNVKIVKLEDVYVVVETKTTFLSSKLSETVTTYTKPNKLYTLKIEINW
jgi:hypothetical protein